MGTAAVSCMKAIVGHALNRDHVGPAIKRIRAERGKQGNGNVSTPQAYDTRLIAENENIGNLKGKKYLDSMAQVWRSCAEVLKPGGILCCITRDCVKDGKRVPVGEQNKALLIAAGLEFIECETWRVPNLSFWRILQQRKNPDAPLIDEENVWIFQKPAGEATR